MHIGDISGQHASTTVLMKLAAQDKSCYTEKGKTSGRITTIRKDMTPAWSASVPKKAENSHYVGLLWDGTSSSGDLGNYKETLVVWNTTAL